MDVLMPQLGETVAEGKITKWFKQAGDDVKPGENLFEIETDKTSMEVPSTVAGKLTAINFKVGDVAKVGAVVAVIGGDAAQPKPSAQPAVSPPPLTPANTGVPSQSAPRPTALEFRAHANERERVFAYSNMHPFREVRTPEKNYGSANIGGRQVTPLARRLAGESGIDLTNIKGSGPHGRIVAKDVEVGRAKHAAPATSAASVYLVADVEIGRALALCAEANAGTPKGKQGDSSLTVSLNDFVIKAWAAALQGVSAARRDSRLASSDIAVTVARDEEFPSVVIRNAGTKSLMAIAAELRDLTAGGKRGNSDDLSGAPSVIHNFGAHGVREAGVAVSPPHSLALTIAESRRAPVEAADGSVKFISVMTVTLSCDRVVDGARGAQLLAAFKGFVESPVTALI